MINKESSVNFLVKSEDESQGIFFDSMKKVTIRNRGFYREYLEYLSFISILCIIRFFKCLRNDTHITIEIIS